MIDKGTTRPDVIPAHLWPGIKAYAMHGRPMGDFLKAVFSNELFGAINRADENSLKALLDLTRYIYNECPSACHGSREKVCSWEERGGLLGRSSERVPEEA